jgi:ATP-dependent DNA helicase RecG
MVIEHAERFGLAQLHQLRGRVGRGAASRPASCSTPSRWRDGAGAAEGDLRNTDGFEIAREDLRLRGPGEFIGSRQSGVPLLRYADLEGAAASREQAPFAPCGVPTTPSRDTALERRQP